jgi:hypothetical protein
MKELVLIGGILLAIFGGAAYWYWFQEREFKALLKRIKQVPVVMAVLVWFGIED